MIRVKWLIVLFLFVVALQPSFADDGALTSDVNSGHQTFQAASCPV
jgi:hypothetical protein